MPDALTIPPQAIPCKGRVRVVFSFQIYDLISLKVGLNVVEKDLVISRGLRTVYVYQYMLFPVTDSLFSRFRPDQYVAVMIVLLADCELCWDWLR